MPTSPVDEPFPTRSPRAAEVSASGIAWLVAAALAGCAKGLPLEITDGGHTQGHTDASTTDDGAVNGSDDGVPGDETIAPIDAGATGETPAIDDDSAGFPDTPVIDDAPIVVEVSTGSCASAGSVEALAMFDFSSLSGAETKVAATSTASGVTAGALSRSASLTAASGSGSINASGWSTASSDDKSAYYSAKITPPSGCAIDLTSVALTEKSSSAGPTHGDVGTDADAFATLTSFATDGSATVAVTAAGVAGSPIEIRIFGYGATSSGGTMRLTGTLTISGSLR